MGPRKQRDIPEFHTSGYIRIAPNISVPVTPRLIQLIDSAAFQRLRQIRQLSLSDRVFPSATHTRFSHGLGVYANVLDYLTQLDQHPAFGKQFEDKDYLAILLAGLLHDLGHYPCSHQLDHIQPFPKHEALTIALIRGEMTIDGQNLADIIWEGFGVEPEAICRLLGPAHGLDTRLQLLKQIIDSPVDADKCDYLPRDSYYCGVDYGTGFDRTRFIGNLLPSKDGISLCIHEKGLMSAERFQLARYWMYRSVYWGHTVRALITMLSRACSELEGEVSDCDWTHQLLAFNDHNFLAWLHDRVSEPIRELVAMVHFRREPYKRLFTISFHHDPHAYQILQQEDIRQGIRSWIAAWALKMGHPMQDHHLIWDVPPTYKNDRWESFPIRLSNGQERSIAEESPITNALSQAFLNGVRKIRLFCHPQLATLIRANPDAIPSLDRLLAEVTGQA